MCFTDIKKDSTLGGRRAPSKVIIKPHFTVGQLRQAYVLRAPWRLERCTTISLFLPPSTRLNVVSNPIGSNLVASSNKHVQEGREETSNWDEMKMWGGTVSAAHWSQMMHLKGWAFCTLAYQKITSSCAYGSRLWSLGRFYSSAFECSR